MGGGNSAGQAVVFLAPKVKRLHLVVRGPGLEASMSRYLIDRIAALPNIELHTGTEVVALDGDESTGSGNPLTASRRSSAFGGALRDRSARSCARAPKKALLPSNTTAPPVFLDSSTMPMSTR